MKKLLFVCLALIAVLTACQAPLQPTAQNIGDAYMKALETGDAEAMLAQVSEDVALVIDGGAIFHNELSGKEALREYSAGNAVAGFQLELTGAPIANDNLVTYPDRFAINDFKAMGVDWVTGQDVLTIENGKVTRDVWTIDPAAETALNAAILRSMVMGWTQTVNDKDLEGNLAMVADDVQRLVIGDPFFHNEISGKEDFATALAEQIALGMTVEYPDGPQSMQVEGNVVTAPVRFGLDPFREAGVEWVSGVDEITFTDGKISRHVFTISDESVAELGAAFAAQEQGLTPEKLAGAWGYDNPDIGKGYTRYHEDGTYEMVRIVTGSEIVWDTGSYAIEGDTVTFTTGEAHYCKVGAVGVYKMSITEDGQLEVTTIEDNCWRRKLPEGEAFYLEPITP